MTTRRRDLLNGFEDRAAQEYKVEPMGDYHALQLFRKHAFQGDAPQDASEYDSLSIDIAKTIGGLPLAIEVTASNLHLKRKNIKIWRTTLEFLKEHHEDKVGAAFMASYNSLNDHSREIFLDVACFFIGKDERIPSYMWEACGYYPDKHIEHLRDMHLLEDEKNGILRMHDLLRDFGRKLADSNVLHERCRLWNRSDALSFLKDGKGTENVKGTGLTFEEFSKMSNLRYLGLDRAHIRGNIENLPPNLRYLGLDRARFRGNIKNLPPNLRWLEWRNCNSIPKLGNMHLKELLILDLSWSIVNQSPKFWKQIAKKVEKLKVLNLQGCFYLRGYLHLPGLINLEMLILEDCPKLNGIGPFIRNLTKLSSLNLRNCQLITRLPKEQNIKSLTELLIDGSSIRIIYFQEGSLENLKILSARNCQCLQDISTLGSLRNLSNLALDGADIHELPDTFEFLPKLQTLSLRGCRKLGKIPTSIGKLQLLEVMDLSETTITELPESVKDLRNLKMLKMLHTCLQKFPEGIVNCKKLEEIDFSVCILMEGQVPRNISGLSSLRILRLCATSVAGLPQSICGLSCLQILDILGCKHLQALPKLPSSLLRLRWESNGTTVPDLSNLTNLKELVLRHDEHEPPRWGLLNLKTPKTSRTPDIGWISRLTSLETLDLSLPNVKNLPRNFSALAQLWELSLSYMEKLDLTQLPSSSSLRTLHLKFCKIPKPKFSGLKYMSELKLEFCDLAEIDGLEDLTLLEVLYIICCNRIANLNGLKDLPRLRKVQGIFSARPSLPKFSKPVEVDIFPP